MFLQYIVLIWFLVVHSFNCCEGEDIQKSRYKSLKCISKNETMIKFRYCRVKVTRNSSSLAVNVTIPEVLNKPVYTKWTVFYKYGLIYREIIRVPEGEVCDVLKDPNSAHPLLREIINGLGSTLGQFKNVCDLSGDIDFLFQYDLSRFPSIAPSGLYKVEMEGRKKSIQFVTIIFEMEVVSSIKTSF